MFLKPRSFIVLISQALRPILLERPEDSRGRIVGHLFENPWSFFFKVDHGLLYDGDIDVVYLNRMVQQPSVPAGRQTKLKRIGADGIQDLRQFRFCQLEALFAELVRYYLRKRN
jgi:hypothetical protein